MRCVVANERFEMLSDVSNQTRRAEDAFARSAEGAAGPLIEVSC